MEARIDTVSPYDGPPVSYAESGPGIFPVPVVEKDIYAPLDEVYGTQFDEVLDAYRQATQEDQ